VVAERRGIMQTIAIATIIISFIFTFLNGFDGCSVVASIVVSRSINPKRALLIAGAAELIGPLIFGTSVAATIAKGIIKFDYISSGDQMNSLILFFSAVSGAIVWNLITWWKRIPSSSSHALVGGLLGGGIAAYGAGSVNWWEFLHKVVLVLFTSPLMGFVIGYICLKIVVRITKDYHPRTNDYLKNMQLFSMFALGMSHGSSDAQKSMGIIAVILLLSGYTSSFVVPLWVILISSLSISLGLITGGWRLMKTLGKGIFNIKPIHSFSSQIASTSTIIAALIIGGPVSTTQIINSSVMGVGTAERKNAVKWGNVKSILTSWILTVPSAAIISATICFIIKYV
jgi:inorganic phosphate transporter, PiT family